MEKSAAGIGSPLDSRSSYPSFTKAYKVEYFKIRDDLWGARAQLEDPIYNVIVNFNVSVPDFIIRDSSAIFLMHPYQECLQMVPRMRGIVGVDLRGPFRDVLRREFLGPKGCDTVFNLVSMAGKALIFTYLSKQEGLGAVTEEEYLKFIEKGLGCVVDQRGGPPRKPFYCTPSEHKSDLGSKMGGMVDLNETIRTRRFTADYLELNDDLWRSRLQVVDFEHNIIVLVDVSRADLVVRDASITFLRQPYKECGWMEPRMKKIVGACLATDFRERVANDFVGKEGCSNVYNLFNSMHRGFLQFYLMRNTIMERITPAQEALCKEGLKQNCVACST